MCVIICSFDIRICSSQCMKNGAVANAFCGAKAKFDNFSLSGIKARSGTPWSTSRRAWTAALQSPCISIEKLLWNTVPLQMNPKYYSCKTQRPWSGALAQHLEYVEWYSCMASANQSLLEVAYTHFYIHRHVCISKYGMPHAWPL